MAITLDKIAAAQHESAVEWIRELFWYWNNVDTLTPIQAYRVVNRHYDGGWDQFIEDLGDGNRA